MKYKYLVIWTEIIWGKNEINKEYFLDAAALGKLIIDTEHNTYFDKDENNWLPIKGDED